jgi:hypothetical protein
VKGSYQLFDIGECGLDVVAAFACPSRPQARHMQDAFMNQPNPLGALRTRTEAKKKTKVD